MRIASIDNYIRGWFVGNFDPSLYKTNDVEIAYRTFKAGDREQKHFHKIATEINLITKGVVSINDFNFYKDDIVILEPNEVSDFKVIEDCEMVVIKLPGANDDKYIVNE